MGVVGCSNRFGHCLTKMEGTFDEDGFEQDGFEQEKKGRKMNRALTVALAEEHARKSTTSIDFKISKALQNRTVPIIPNDDDSESDSDKQEEEDRIEDEDEETGDAVGVKSFYVPSDGASFSANSFIELNLSRPLLRACEALGYSKPTPIQSAVIPLAMNGSDICGSAVTGSGKTAAFALPTLERLLFRPKRVPAIRVLILTPTRELAVQVHSMIEKLAQFTDIRCCLVVGGLSTKVQEAALRSMPDIVVATPGRMIDHLRVNQEAVLLALCSKTFTSKVIIFSGTKQAAHRLKILFGLAGLKATELHGNLTQIQRLDALELFRKQQVDFLIATDVAARGLDIIGVQTVINYECPREYKSYIHRVGRTARAGREGYAVTFVTDNDRSLLKDIAKKAGSKLRSRTVAEQSITKWSEIIEQMEDQVAEILEEEREERTLRKAEMEVSRAENLIAHREEIYSRPKKTWFVTEKEKRLVAKASKASVEKEMNSGKAVISAQEAEDLKMKEKRKREHEKNLPRKKRRKLEAAREMLEDENQMKKLEGNDKNKNEKTGLSLVELGYRRAKAVKAVKKALDTGKIVKKNTKKSEHPNQRQQSRTREMQELFQSDMSEKKQKRNSVPGKKKYKRK
ncbi:dead-box atp-dependent rna helicase 28 [Quercus suber]|uniref:Dead-box atp-dependent rna helicase 28 n=1 Tax=Quercus suber TaxID=58331 RepID=A0AAW0M5N2_QUESU